MSKIEDTKTSVGDDVYTEWMGVWKIYRRPYDLPDTCNCDGRPVWEQIGRAHV